MVSISMRGLPGAIPIFSNITGIVMVHSKIFPYEIALESMAEIDGTIGMSALVARTKCSPLGVSGLRNVIGVDIALFDGEHANIF